jgi:hypothetical protein
MLVASGAARDKADTQSLGKGHNNDVQPHDGGHNNDFSYHDWLNPGGVTYSFSGWNNYFPDTYSNYYYTTPVAYPTYYYNYDPWWTTPIASMPLQASTGAGDTPVTIQSQGMRGYQVFLDENYIGTEGTGGDPLDGVFNFKVVGNQNHNIRVYDGQFNYPKSMYFVRGVLKIINVEPGTAVYI